METAAGGGLSHRPKWLTFSSALIQKYKAEETLVQALMKGSLTLFLGAGVSQAAKGEFPNWIELVERCCASMNIAFDTNKRGQNKYLREQMERVHKACLTQQKPFVELVKSSLYTITDYNAQELSTRLLLSLGAIAMRSVRGAARAIVNYNFDDLLTWYLTLHGFKVQTVSAYPTYLEQADMVIYHPHGFLPLLEEYQDQETEKVILTQSSYRDSYKEVDPWNELQIGMLTSSLGLFVGLSGEDEHLELLWHRAHERVRETDKRTIIGFIIMVDSEENREKDDIRLGMGVATTYITGHEELPEFLLNICRLAAKKA